jgi:cellobiose dehydrogenase (acceptor)
MLNHLVVSAILAVATASPAFRSGSSQFRGGPGVGRQITNASSDSSWDYIIAGAGPAGIIAATRLAEANKKVLLLEYGGPSTFSSGGNFSTTFNANSVTEQNLTIYDVPGQSSPLFSTSAGKYCPDVPGSAGCLLGGGVSVNALMFIHPPSHDFDDKWPTGWKWSDVESAANSLYEVNPGSSTPSADGIIYDASEFDIMSSFLGAQGFSEVDSIAEPDKKSLAYAHPPFNVKVCLILSSHQSFQLIIAEWRACWSSSHISPNCPNQGQLLSPAIL